MPNPRNDPIRDTRIALMLFTKGLGLVIINRVTPFSGRVTIRSFFDGNNVLDMLMKEYQPKAKSLLLIPYTLF